MKAFVSIATGTPVPDTNLLLTQWETILIAPGKSGKGECLWAETFCGT